MTLGSLQAPALTQPLGAQIEAIANDWHALLQEWRASADGRQLLAWVDAQVQQGEVVFPADVFRALRVTALRDTRVVILGQDPYHTPGQAEGLAFSVPAGHRIPPSLRNIFREIKRSHPQRNTPTCGHLGTWAQQGVLLLNTTLTVAQGRPASHAGRGWESLTGEVVHALSVDSRPKVFMLWGAHAQTKAAHIQAAAQHLILRCNHPSPLSATRGPNPFIGCDHFRAAGDHLNSLGDHWSWPL